MNGKGSRRPPTLVDDKTVTANWVAVFGDTKPKSKKCKTTEKNTSEA